MTAFICRNAVVASLLAVLASSGAQAAAGYNGPGGQGVSLNGTNLNGSSIQGTAVSGLRQPTEAAPLTVEAVILRSGETVQLR